MIYRNYKKKTDQNLIKKIKYFCKKKKIKFLLSNNFKLAIKLDLDGVYLPSFNKDFRHNNYFLKKEFIVLGSAIIDRLPRALCPNSILPENLAIIFPL